MGIKLLCLLIVICATWLAWAEGVVPQVAVEIERGPEALSLTHAGGSLAVSLLSPAVTLSGERLGGLAPLSIAGDIAAPEGLTLYYPAQPLSTGGTLLSHVTITFDASAGELRKTLRLGLSEDAQRRLIEDITLERLPAAGVDFSPAPPYSYPAFGKGWFAGIEFPVATTRIEGDEVILSHAPGKWLEPGEWRESRTELVGFTPVGQEIAVFKQYVRNLRGPRPGIHINYNSWWTSGVPFNEEEILGLMDEFRVNLTERSGQHFDTFAIDLGWSDPKTLWEIDRKSFPQGFEGISKGTQRMDSYLGLWMSPSVFYPQAFDTEWAREQGYETQVIDWGSKLRLMCLGGPKYQQAYQQRMVEMATVWGVRHYKFDGFYVTCNETNHGHEPGVLSCETVAEGLISVFEALREAAPDTWLEPTCFGYNPSPWWFRWVDSALTTFGDDAPPGRVPCPVWSESLTSGRDYFCLQGAYWLPLPAVGLEALGLIHQTPYPYLNDGVTVLLRGHQFMPVYLNPKYMNETRWDQLGGLFKWAREHSDLLSQSEVLLPVSWQGGKAPKLLQHEKMPREPYGYAHFVGEEGLVHLRNPWIAESSYTFKLDASVGFPEGLTGLSVWSVYPEARLYAEGVGYGDSLTVPLAPYETVVLRFGAASEAPAGLPTPPAATSGVQVKLIEQEVKALKFDDAGVELTADTTPLIRTPEALNVKLKAGLAGAQGEPQLLVLLESDHTVSEPGGVEVLADGVPVETRQEVSDAGWTATMLPKAEYWRFLLADLPKGTKEVSLRFLCALKELPSVWVWDKRDVAAGPRDLPELLPAPEVISLGGACLLAVEAETLAALPRETANRPVEKINGVFLDTLDPVKATQGYGKLERNQSVWEKSLGVAGKLFSRGLGSHANAELVWNIEGKYSRFQTWVGCNHNNAATVTFEVLVDGQKRWESGLMRRDMEAKWVDLDVSGARELKVLIGDAGDGINGDHADLGEARLLF